MHKRGMRGKYSRETSLGNDILRLSEWVAVSSMEDGGGGTGDARQEKTCAKSLGHMAV